jgi:ribonuclease Y
MSTTIIITFFILFIISSASGYTLTGVFAAKVSSRSHLAQSRIVSKAKKEADLILSEADEQVLVRKKKIKDMQSTYQETSELLQKRVDLKEQTLKKRDAKNTAIKYKYEKLEAEINVLKVALAQRRESLENELTKKAGLTAGEAKEVISIDLEKDYSPFFEQSGNKYVENCKEIAHKQAIHFLKSIMQKYAEPSSVDHLDKTIKVPRDVIKGKLIGRGAKNLVYLEEQTGADIIFEDQRGFITVSCFNLFIQETVKNAIIKLMRLDKIDTEAIDKALFDARSELDVKLQKIGTKAADIIGIENRDPELMKLIGRLKYRTSYGQNILYHSMEKAYFSAQMAAEIGADTEVAKLGGFFHDLGKAIDQEVEGSHDYLSKELLEKFGFSYEVVHAAWTHHDAIPIETVEAQIVKAADAISAGRPGARTESAQMYVERIQGLEKIAYETKGVKKAFALSAGRELRTIIDENTVKDEEMQAIAEKMASEIEANLAYPGKIKVNLIRTVESIDYANKGASKSNANS